MTERVPTEWLGDRSEIRVVQRLIQRARSAQEGFSQADQETVDRIVTAAGWAIVEPGRNRSLAERAVRDTGMGNVADKIQKNRRKTIGLLRDLKGARTVGVLSENPNTGIAEIARPVGVVAAITPSTNPAATPANNLINALKGRNAIVLAPSPKGAATCALLVDYVHRELAKVGAPADLVQTLPPPCSRPLATELMRQADLVVATGSRTNILAAYASGTPALGVGAGNVASIVLPGADYPTTANRIADSKTFDNATSCSSENSLILVGDAWSPMLAALERTGAILATNDEQIRLQAAMFPDGRLAPACAGQAISSLARLAGLYRTDYDAARFILVQETGVGPGHPFSGEKLSPVLTLYRVTDFDSAIAQAQAIYEYQGKGHSVGIHGATPEQVLRLGLELPVCRIIVEQAHCFAVGGAFDNGLPFSLSMGCGTWGGNGFCENLNYRHFLNIVRIVRSIPAREPSEAEIFSEYWSRYGAH